MPFLDAPARLFLGLSHIRGVGFKTLRDAGGIDAIGDRVSQVGVRDFLQELTGSEQPTNIQDKVFVMGEVVARKLHAWDVDLLRIGDPLYPSRFLDLPPSSRPLWIFCRGQLELLERASVAVVGTRDPSEIGDFLARYAVTSLAELNAPVVSGLAKGIDATAHEWAIKIGLPTISVLGTGIFKTYPSRNAELADLILDDGGLLISEYLPDAGPTKESFVWRNRLQAALASCVIAPEWKRSSGTAHTIRFAKGMKRETINLRLDGLGMPEDHGEADIIFDVPSRHAAFRQLVLDALNQASGRRVEQTDMFSI